MKESEIMAIAKLKPDAEIKPVLELPQVQKETSGFQPQHQE